MYLTKKKTLYLLKSATILTCYIFLYKKIPITKNKNQVL